MSIYLRTVLFVAAVLTFGFIARKLKKSQVQIMDAFFWILFSTVLLILGIFPQIGTFFADILGIMSAANFIFLVVIFLLIIRSFLQTLKISNLESKLSNLIQEIAIRKLGEKNEDIEGNFVQKSK